MIGFLCSRSLTLGGRSLPAMGITTWMGDCQYTGISSVVVEITTWWPVDIKSNLLFVFALEVNSNCFARGIEPNSHRDIPEFFFAFSLFSSAGELNPGHNIDTCAIIEIHTLYSPSTSFSQPSIYQEGPSIWLHLSCISKDPGLSPSPWQAVVMPAWLGRLEWAS